MVTLIKIVGVSFAVIGVILSGYLVYLQTRLKQNPTGGLLLFKWLAFGGFLIAPVATTAMGNYHLFEGSRETKSCLECHSDMDLSHGDTLAAKHYQNRWIAKDQCYTCHTDYGLNGTIKAKQDGFRHLVKFVTKTYDEPIHFRDRYNNQNCLNCHEGTPKFERVPSHHTIRDRLTSSAVSCTNCHGAPHP